MIAEFVNAFNDVFIIVTLSDVIAEVVHHAATTAEQMLLLPLKVDVTSKSSRRLLAHQFLLNGALGGNRTPILNPVTLLSVRSGGGYKRMSVIFVKEVHFGHVFSIVVESFTFRFWEGIKPLPKRFTKQLIVQIFFRGEIEIHCESWRSRGESNSHVQVLQTVP
jgi:hypothetical protein